MKKILVKTQTKNYPIFIGGNILKQFDKYQKKYLKSTNKILIISTNNIPRKYLNKLKKNIKKNERVYCHIP